MIDFEAEFEKIYERSKIVAEHDSTGTVTLSNGILTLTAPEGTTDKIIYFHLPEDASFENVDQIQYVNIPDDAYMVVTSEEKDIHIDTADNTIDTTINGTWISNAGSHNTNNNKNSSRILYNFPNATDVYISCNFNGTILAPHADVTSEEACEGHLSGALIAKSFRGGLEFGYRPFLGLVEILGTASNYTIDVSKVDADGKFLDGATLGLYEYDEQTETYAETPVRTFVSSGAKDTITVEPGSYMLKEVNPPDGYVMSDEGVLF